MRIVVLVKDVPDTYDERRLDLETGYADREAGQSVLDEIDERALELALTTAERLPDVEVAVLTMGPQAARPTVRSARDGGRLGRPRRRRRARRRRPHAHRGGPRRRPAAHRIRPRHRG
ncbi:MAG TPA: hypothetical protein VKY79_02670 [Actinomycetaceae bacterium]|nr:hypothetical protein [Actinomycetaceae bacterium]